MISGLSRLHSSRRLRYYATRDNFVDRNHNLWPSRRAWWKVELADNQQVILYRTYTRDSRDGSCAKWSFVQVNAHIRYWLVHVLTHGVANEIPDVIIIASEYGLARYGVVLWCLIETRYLAKVYERVCLALVDDTWPKWNATSTWPVWALCIRFTRSTSTLFIQLDSFLENSESP